MIKLLAGRHKYLKGAIVREKNKKIKGLVLKAVLPESYPTEIYIGYVISDRTGESTKEFVVKNIQYNENDRHYIVYCNSKHENSYHVIEKDVVGVVIY